MQPTYPARTYLINQQPVCLPLDVTSDLPVIRNLDSLGSVHRDDRRQSAWIRRLCRFERREDAAVRLRTSDFVATPSRGARCIQQSSGMVCEESAWPKELASCGHPSMASKIDLEPINAKRKQALRDERTESVVEDALSTSGTASRLVQIRQRIAIVRLEYRRAHGRSSAVRLTLVLHRREVVTRATARSDCSRRTESVQMICRSPAVELLYASLQLARY